MLREPHLSCRSRSRSSSVDGKLERDRISAGGRSVDDRLEDAVSGIPRRPGSQSSGDDDLRSGEEMPEVSGRQGRCFNSVVEVGEADVGEEQVGDLLEEARQLKLGVGTFEDLPGEAVVF